MKYKFSTDDVFLINKIITGFYYDSVAYELKADTFYGGIEKSTKYTVIFDATTPERVLSYMWQQEWENNHCNQEIISIREQLKSGEDIKIC